MVSVNQLTVSFGGIDLFNNITFLVNPRDRIGLVGKNGAGKSTLLKIFAGLQEATSGTITIPQNIDVGYLPQQMIHQSGKTVMEETRMAFDRVLGLLREIEEINVQIAERTDYESESYLDMIHRLTELNERYEMLGGNNIDADVEKTLVGLGFSVSDFNRQTSELSGGWRMRIELAKVLLRRPDVLLLDEPTNHLDIESIQWLESFLKDFPGAVVLVSHDRAFLDNVTQRTVEISLGKIYDYKAPYTRYLDLRKEFREQQLAAYRNQQKMIQDTEDFIERFRYKATKAVQVQSRIKQLGKIDRIEIEDEDLSAIHVRFPAAPRSGTVAVETDSLVKRYGDKLILDGIDFKVHRGEKIAFAGKNGEGKSTLSKIIMGEVPHEQGIVKIGHNVHIGYFAQNQDEIMDENLTVFQTIDQVAVGDIRTKIRDLLGAFLFRGEDIDKKVRVLSGGERSRLAMVKLLLEPYNLLLLDEPTNHLDMRSKDILKQALLKYDGTLIVVSHDRDFLDGLVDKVYEFRDKKIKEHIGGIYEFLQKKKVDNLQELNRKAPVDIPKPISEPDPGPKDAKGNYLEKKEWDRQVRKAAAQVKETEEKIARIEREIETTEHLLAVPEHIEPDELEKMSLHYQQLQHDLEEAMGCWEKLTLELEKIKK
ncbi:MAG: ABC-F family ATP-binding cassette domain-containing protein [Bacteroidales bacterium]|jgi:ATP-binding cassette subfamily F protein 3|nr:ABC-F family ATP-binding cassette domain-containing protein [Bacteroidales bacterium]